MRLPTVFRSIRFRLAFTYTVIVFALAVVVVGVVNLALTRSLETETVSGGRQLTTVIDPATGRSVTVERDVQVQFVTLEQLVNARTIDEMQRISLWLLIGLFPVSVGVGWFIADRALRPIEDITTVAQDIQRTDDLSRRIDMQGPDDERLGLHSVDGARNLGRVLGGFEQHHHVRFIVRTHPDPGADDAVLLEEVARGVGLGGQRHRHRHGWVGDTVPGGEVDTGGRHHREAEKHAEHRDEEETASLHRSVEDGSRCVELWNATRSPDLCPTPAY